MSRSLDKLQPEFHAKVTQLLSDFRSRAVRMRRDLEMRVYFTLRTPEEQARLWRQSRTSQDIRNAIEMLRASNAPYMANVLESVGPQHGARVTNALPGQSWHNHGLAIDAFVSEDGKSEWDSGHPGYALYAECARDLGLTAGFHWPSCDAVHVQMPAQGSPLFKHRWAEIDQMMKERFQ